MSKVFNIGGIACIVKYHKDFDETFFHPAQSETWSEGVLDYLANIAEQNGRDITGGHDYYMAVRGNVFVA
jgi:hypothetical protein